MGVVAAALPLVPIAASGAIAADGLAADDAYSVAEDTDGGLVVPVESGVLANDTGGTAALCVLSIDTSQLQGALDAGGATDGSFTYTPPLNFNGQTTFSYQVGTKAGEACPEPSAGGATVTITVDPVNDAPSASNDTFSALKDRTLTVSAPGVLGNDSDIEGDQLSAILVDSPNHGSLTLAANGGFSYAPANGYTGADLFSYRASDGQKNSPIRVVNLTVTAIPTPSPTPAPTPTTEPTASPEPSPSASALPSDPGLPSASTLASGLPSASPSGGPVTGPVVGEGGPPLFAILALVVLIGLLAVAGVFFVRSQRAGGEEAYATGPYDTGTYDDDELVDELGEDDVGDDDPERPR